MKYQEGRIKMDEREEFNKWIAKSYHSNSPNRVIDHLWAGWQARAALDEQKCLVCERPVGNNHLNSLGMWLAESERITARAKAELAKDNPNWDKIK